MEQTIANGIMAINADLQINAMQLNKVIQTHNKRNKLNQANTQLIVEIKRRVTEGMNAIRRNTSRTAKTAAHVSKSIRAQMN